MHIADDILPLSMTLPGFLGAGLVVADGLRRLAPATVPRVALMTSAFLICSLIHVPLGPTSVHLLLHGMVGIILGPLSGLAIAVALALQAVLIGHGGITALGVNVLCMTAGAIVARTVFAVVRGHRSARWAFLGGFAGATLAVWVSALAVYAALRIGGDEFRGLAGVVLLAHAPISVIEGLVAASAAAFIVRVKPDLFTVVWDQRRTCDLHRTLTNRPREHSTPAEAEA